MFQCPRCRADNPPGARFCQQCGAQFFSQPVLEKAQAEKDKDLGYKVMGYGLLGICLIVIVSILGSVKNKSDSMQKASSSAPVTTPAQAPLTPATPPPVISNAEKLSRAKAAMKTGTQYKTAESLLSQIPVSDPAYKEAKPLLEQARKKIAETEGVLIRGRLKDSYTAIIRNANPHLNFVEAKIIKVGKGFGIYAAHEFFSQYSFSAGDEARITQTWISENRDDLRTAGVVQVGLMGKGPYSSRCWLELVLQL